VVKQTRSLATA